MDKVSEVVEACEQETPFHLLSQEDQQRILDANQKKVREAPTLHEWNIRVETPFVWLVISIPVGIMMSIGMWLVYSDDDAGWAPIIMGAIVAAFTRYLWLADKNYHYRLTTEGVIVTYQDAIPEAAYTIVRGLVWFGLVWFGLVWFGLAWCGGLCDGSGCIGAISPGWCRRHGALCGVFH